MTITYGSKHGEVYLTILFFDEDHEMTLFGGLKVYIVPIQWTFKSQVAWSLLVGYSGF